MDTAKIHIHADLVEACKSGDRSAQSRLYKLYARAMYNICTRMLRDKAAAEDALQEAFISAFSNLKSFQGRSSFGAWLKRIVVNKCLSHISRNKQLFEPIEDEMLEDITEEPTPRGLDLNPKLVHQAIKNLPQGCRIVFTLYQLEGYDHKEISEILNVSVSTSKSQYHRAKKLLQQQLVGKAVRE